MVVEIECEAAEPQPAVTRAIPVHPAVDRAYARRQLARAEHARDDVVEARGEERFAVRRAAIRDHADEARVEIAAAGPLDDPVREHDAERGVEPEHVYRRCRYAAQHVGAADLDNQRVASQFGCKRMRGR